MGEGRGLESVAGLLGRLPVSSRRAVEDADLLSLLSFRYNFVELAYFLAYVQAQYVRTHPVPTAVPPPPMVDNVMPVQNEGILVPEAVGAS